VSPVRVWEAPPRKHPIYWGAFFLFKSLGIPIFLPLSESLQAVLVVDTETSLVWVSPDVTKVWQLIRFIMPAMFN
jgi:hypothetical protein